MSQELVTNLLYWLRLPALRNGALEQGVRDGIWGNDAPPDEPLAILGR